MFALALLEKSFTASYLHVQTSINWR